MKKTLIFILLTILFSSCGGFCAISIIGKWEYVNTETTYSYGTAYIYGITYIFNFDGTYEKELSYVGSTGLSEDSITEGTYFAGIKTITFFPSDFGDPYSYDYTVSEGDILTLSDEDESYVYSVVSEVE